MHLLTPSSYNVMNFKPELVGKGGSLSYSPEFGH